MHIASYIINCVVIFSIGTLPIDIDFNDAECGTILDIAAPPLPPRVNDSVEVDMIWNSSQLQQSLTPSLNQPALPPRARQGTSVQLDNVQALPPPIPPKTVGASIEDTAAMKLNSTEVPPSFNHHSGSSSPPPPLIPPKPSNERLYFF